ncbi:uncharacterized protein CPUR_05363 [Claviceps purpurea 20.1]|uniref:Uncharacterized protein n=1 Tax=Claviceps purpurea (strain 20.1) TaxID=1111077 RepID=M1W829_CLAP2|nr:uncharacterized protein CPUR_05363 [Claviceps purpurea 20.1]
MTWGVIYGWCALWLNLAVFSCDAEEN